MRKRLQKKDSDSFFTKWDSGGEAMPTPPRTPCSKTKREAKIIMSHYKPPFEADNNQNGSNKRIAYKCEKSEINAIRIRIKFWVINAQR